MAGVFSSTLHRQGFGGFVLFYFIFPSDYPDLESLLLRTIKFSPDLKSGLLLNYIPAYYLVFTHTLAFYFVLMLYFVGFGDLTKVSHMRAMHSTSNTTPCPGTGSLRNASTNFDRHSWW